jgi:phosphoribosylaminoimidazole carboxylase (NCAIR synthetase)
MKIGIIGNSNHLPFIAQAAYQLGIEISCFASKPIPHQPFYIDNTVGRIKNATKFNHFIESVDAVLFDNLSQFEINTQKRISPDFSIASISKSRLSIKELFQSLNIPHLPFVHAEKLEDLQQLVSQSEVDLLAKPVLKHPFDINQTIKTAEGAQKVWDYYHTEPLLIENQINFDYSVTLIGANNKRGAVFYPLIYSVYSDHLLHTSISPFENTELQEKAEACAKEIFNHFNYQGLLTLRFGVKDDELYATGFSPYLQSSGYLTIEGATISQFELQLRAMLNLHLPQPEMLKPTASINMINQTPKETITQEDVHYYRYYNDGPVRGHIALSRPSVEDIKTSIDGLSVYFG